MLIEKCYINFLNSLQKKYPSKTEAENIANWIFEDTLGKKKYEWKVLDKTSTLTKQQHIKILGIQRKLIEEDMPVQYILNKAYFRDLELFVNPNVLIPRSETEDLVEKILQYLQNNNIQHATLLDIGTGSGCIAIALKKAYPLLDVYAIDISSLALQLAKENAKKYQVEIHFIQVDILSNSLNTLPNKIDIVVSNPPYIPHARKDILDKKITKYEPSIALFVENTDTILFYKKIIEKYNSQTGANTKFYFEIDDEAEIPLKKYCKENNITYYFEKDRFDKIRFLILP